MTDAPAEIHLFLIWERGRHAAARIVDDIREHFVVLDAFEVTWSRAHFARSLTRFYGQSLPPGSDKEQRCGTGAFLLIVVEDPAPVAGTRTVWGSRRTVNTRMFDAKERYRAWAGSGHRVHSTVAAAETDHDLFLLLGERAAAYARASRRPWDGSFRPLARDPTGTGGWTSLAEMLTAVELTIAYVLLPAGVLRRVRLLVEGSWDHWGVEWLVAAPDEEPARGRRAEYAISVAGERLQLELRHVGDGYVDAAWQRAMLRDRVRAPAGHFVLAPSDELHLRLYEWSAHGLALPSSSRLAELASAAGVPPSGVRDEPARQALLELFLREHGYAFHPREEEPTSVPSRAGRLGTAAAGVARRLARRYRRRSRARTDS